jgi:hypothetical protein
MSIWGNPRKITLICLQQLLAQLSQVLHTQMSYPNREYSQQLFQPWICEVQPYTALNLCLCKSEPYCHCSLKQDLIIFYSLSSSSNSSFTPSMVSECSSYFRNSTLIPSSSWLRIVAFGVCRLVT